MFFNSIEFAVFLPTIFVLYWFVFNRNLRVQNFFLLAASYVFYGWWDPRFLLLIFISSCVDFTIGIKLKGTDIASHRKRLLFISILVNIGLLGFFKYYNFFADSFVSSFSLFGKELRVDTLNVILPVGISFYTFQTLSYTIDIYRRKLEPTRDIISFFAFLAFFPQLVAGPIERAKNLLPQFHKNRVFDYDKASDGARQIVLGLFKKMVIADNCAYLVDKVFADPGNYSGSSLLLGAILFAFQIYCDFSGYSDIAIGTGRLLGFNLMRNFNYPYFSRDIAEFWRRWHISLSTWFRDYVYIPLGGSQGTKGKVIRNVFIIFLVSGLWHGANWTFVVWGFLHALYFVPLLLLKRNRKYLGAVAEGKILPSLTELLSIITTLLLVSIAWIFFRADSVGDAFSYLNHLADVSLFSFPEIISDAKAFVIYPLVCLIVVEWIQRQNQHAFEFPNWNPVLRRIFYVVVFLTTITIGDFGNSEFIYFQF